MHVSFDKDLPDLDRFHHPRFEEGSGISDFDEIQNLLRTLRLSMQNESRAMALAKITCHIFDNAAIEVRPCDPFGVNIAGWEPDCVRYPWRMMQSVIRDWEMELYETEEGKEMLALCEDFRNSGAGWCYPDNCHSKPNWEDILALGLPGLRERVAHYRDEWIEKGEYDEEKRDFYESVLLVYDGFIRLLGRFADLTEKKLDESPKMPDLLRALRSLATGAPKDLYEVMLLTFLYALIQEYIMGIQARTLGNIDTLWRPYYERALADGTMTRDEVKELLKYFFMQYEMEANRNNQPVHFGGTDGEGGDLTNDLTFLMLEAYGELSIISPKVQIAVAESTPDALIAKCCDLIRTGHSSIVFANEEVGRASQKHLTSNSEDTKYLCLSGCYNFSMKDNVQPESVGLNLVKGIELAFYNGFDPNSGIAIGKKTGELSELSTFEDFYNAYLAQTLHLLDHSFTISDYYDRNFLHMSPAPLLSANYESSVKAGKDVYYNGSKYHNTVITVSCIGTTVDSLYAVKKYVYEQKAVTLSALRDILATNWEGHEALRETIANDKEKYGNNLDRVDAIAVDVMKKISDYIHSKKNWLGQSYATDGEGIDHGIRFGAQAGATPNGRYAGDQFSKNLQASFGCDRRGLLAYLASVTKIDAEDFPNGAPIDFALHPSAAEGDEGLATMVSLVRNTFRKGGSAIQCNVYSAEQLRDAQAHPENYKGLQVRLCGWSQYFNKLTRDEQEMLIRQIEMVPQ